MHAARFPTTVYDVEVAADEFLAAHCTNDGAARETKY